MPVKGDFGGKPSHINDPMLTGHIGADIKGIKSNGTDLFIIKVKENQRDQVCKLDSNLCVETVADEHIDRILFDSEIISNIFAVNSLVYYLKGDLVAGVCQVNRFYSFDTNNRMMMPIMFWQLDRRYKRFTVLCNRFALFYATTSLEPEITLTMRHLINIDKNPLSFRLNMPAPLDICEVPDEWSVILLVSRQGVYKVKLLGEKILWHNDVFKSLTRVTCDKKGRVFAVSGLASRHITICVFDLNSGKIIMFKRSCNRVKVTWRTSCNWWDLIRITSVFLLFLNLHDRMDFFLCLICGSTLQLLRLLQCVDYLITFNGFRLMALF